MGSIFQARFVREHDPTDRPWRPRVKIRAGVTLHIKRIAALFLEPNLQPAIGGLMDFNLDVRILGPVFCFGHTFRVDISARNTRI